MFMHIDNARVLDAERMNKAQEKFMNTEINFEFTCDRLYVRRFNGKTQQYSDIIDKIDFNS